MRNSYELLIGIKDLEINRRGFLFYGVYVLVMEIDIKFIKEWMCNILVRDKYKKNLKVGEGDR